MGIGNETGKTEEALTTIERELKVEKARVALSKQREALATIQRERNNTT